MTQDWTLVKSGSVKDIYQSKTNPDQLKFIFSDRYSIFDYGEMPDPIPSKGLSISKATQNIFNSLSKLGLVHSFLEGQENAILVKKFNIIPPILLENGSYNYANYLAAPSPKLIPLEVVFRFGIPVGSSFPARFNANKEYFKNNYSLTVLPEENGFFSTTTHAGPIVEFFTKLESTDRPLQLDEAEKISGCDPHMFKQLTFQTKKIAQPLKDIIESSGLILWDGKFEFGLNQNNELVLVDSVGLDELRVTVFNSETKQHIPLSKEVLRQFYKNSPETSQWYKESMKCKQADPHKWTSMVAPPPHLPHDLIEWISKMYDQFAGSLAKQNTNWNNLQEQYLCLKQKYKF